MKKLLILLATVFISCALAVCFFISHNELLYNFNNLSDFQKYVSTHKEIPQSELSTVNFETFYKNQQPIAARILRILNIHTFMFNNIDHIIKLLGQLQKNVGTRPESSIINLKSDSTIYIWGNLHGSLHTLVDSLTWLKKNEIISEDLVITKPDTFFVFYDTVLNNSLYGLETLILIGLLRERNPQTVFYIKDSYEQKNEWQNHILQTQLKEVLSYKFQVTKNLNYAINNFFDSLTQHVDFITSEGHSVSITTNTELRSQHDLTNAIAVNIGTTENQTKYLQDPGIRLLGQQIGIPTWLVVSSAKNQSTSHGFAFIQLTSSIGKSTISFFQNNEQGFEERQKFNLLSGGVPEDILKVDQPIKLGSTMSLDLGVPAMGRSVQSGILAYINQVNRTGGINEQLLKLVIFNDNYTPYLARQNVEKLINDAIDIIVLPVGSPTLSAYIELVTQQAIAVLFPVTGSSEFRKPTLTNLINYRASYGDEMTAVVDYLVKQFGLRKFAFFYQDDAYGKSALGPAHAALEKNGITQWTDIPYTRGTIQLTDQSEKIKDLQPEALGLLSTALPTKEFIRLIGVNNLTGVKLFGVSFLGEDTFRYFISSIGLSVIYGAVVPNPHASNLPIVKEYREIMDSLKNHYNNFSLEAYICGAILSHVLKKIPKPVTKENVLKALEAFDHENVKGISLTFNPNTRTISSNVWIETGKADEWIQKEINNENINNR